MANLSQNDRNIIAQHPLDTSLDHLREPLRKTEQSYKSSSLLFDGAADGPDLGPDLGPQKVSLKVAPGTPLRLIKIPMAALQITALERRINPPGTETATFSWHDQLHIQYSMSQHDNALLMNKKAGLILHFRPYILANFEASGALPPRSKLNTRGCLTASMESRFDLIYDPIDISSPRPKSRPSSDTFSISICKDSRPDCVR